MLALLFTPFALWRAARGVNGYVFFSKQMSLHSRLEDMPSQYMYAFIAHVLVGCDRLHAVLCKQIWLLLPHHSKFHLCASVLHKSMHRTMGTQSTQYCFCNGVCNHICCAAIVNAALTE